MLPQDRKNPKARGSVPVSKRVVDRLFTSGSHEVTIDGSDLAPGIYLVEVTVGDTRSTVPIVRAR